MGGIISDSDVMDFRLPAEWELQNVVWFAWPVRDDLWEGSLLSVRERLAALYILVSGFQPVSVLCPGRLQEKLRVLIERFGDSSNITLFDFETDDVWIRDYGPLFLVHSHRQELAVSNWRYNAWGNKFPDQSKDDAASKWIAAKLGVKEFSVDLVLEGGGIESNGSGQLLTTEVVILNNNRNGSTTKQMVEEQLSEHLNIREVLWLGGGLIGDDTDGHIDNLARFFKCDGIVIATTSESDSNFSILRDNYERAKSFKTLEGGAFEIVDLPIPAPIFVDGERMAASYLNYLVVNGAVIMPTYGQAESDARAIRILSECFPGREVVGFDCCEILQEGGAVHCMSQHEPAIR